MLVPKHNTHHVLQLLALALGKQENYIEHEHPSLLEQYGIEDDED